MSTVKDPTFMMGRLKLELFDADGNVKLSREIPNMVMNAGRQWLTERMIGVAAPGDVVMSHMGVGSNNAALAQSQTDLQTHITPKVALTSGLQATENATDDAIEYICTFGPGVCDGTIEEAAIFNNGTAATGVMLCRTLTGTITKGASDTLIVTWRVIVAQ